MKDRELAVVFSDLHIHNYNRFVSGGARLDNTIKYIEYIYDYCNNANIKYILFSGDLFNQQKSLPVSVVNKTADIFERMCKKYPQVSFIAITGNHDQATKQLYGNNAETALSYISKVSDKFFLLDNFFKIIEDNIVIHGLPYYEYKEHFEKALDGIDLDNESINILLMHQTPKQDNFIPADIDPLHPKLIKFDAVFNGHIHKYEILTDNFTNVGSALWRDSDDIGKDKGFLAINMFKPNKHVFISVKDKFPQVIQKTIGGTLSEWEKEQYILEVQPQQEVDSVIDINVEDFAVGLSEKELIENYCKQLGMDDKINYGLKLLTV